MTDKGLTDEEMAALEAESGGLSDEQLSALEKKSAPEPSRLQRAANFIRRGASTFADLHTAPFRVARGWLTGADEPLTKELSPDQPTGAAIRGFGNGLAFGTMPALHGAVAAVQDPANLRAAYVKGRDQARHDDDFASEQQPFAYGGGQVVGAVATPNPFGKLGAGGNAAVRVAGRIASASGQGGLYALGSSRADSWSGEEGKPGMAQDLVEGSGVGGALAAAAEPISGLSRYFSGVKNRAAAAERGNIFEKQSDLVDVRGSSKGGETSTAMKQFDHIEAMATDPAASPEDKAWALEFMAGPAWADLKRQVYSNVRERAGGIGPRLTHSDALLEDAQRGMKPEAIDAATKASLDKSTIRHDVLPRAGRILGRVLPGASISGQIAQSTGAPVTTIDNLINKTPTFTHRVGQVGEAMTAPFAGAANASIRPLTETLDDYLQERPPELVPMEDEERQAEAAAHFSQEQGGKRRRQMP